MDTRKAVANRLLQLCEEKRLSVNALARLSAVPPSTLKNVINGGSKNAGIVTIKKLCDGLEITLREFFDDDIFNDIEQEIKWYFINEKPLCWIQQRGSLFLKVF